MCGFPGEVVVVVDAVYKNIRGGTLPLDEKPKRFLRLLAAASAGDRNSGISLASWAKSRPFSGKSSTLRLSIICPTRELSVSGERRVCLDFNGLSSCTDSQDKVERADLVHTHWTPFTAEVANPGASTFTS